MGSSRRKKRTQSAWTPRPVKQLTELEIAFTIDTFLGELASVPSQLASHSIADEPHDDGGTHFKEAEYEAEYFGENSESPLSPSSFGAVGLQGADSHDCHKLAASPGLASTRGTASSPGAQSFGSDEGLDEFGEYGEHDVECADTAACGLPAACEDRTLDPPTHYLDFG